MNHLLLGTDPQLDTLLRCAEPPCLFLDDGPLVEPFQKTFRAAIFDWRKHSIDISTFGGHRRSKETAYAIYSADPDAGKGTLTVRNGRRKLRDLLYEHRGSLDQLDGNTKDPAVAEALGTLQEVLNSPVLRNVLCRSPNFRFGRASVVAKLDRAAMGEDEALVLGLLLISMFGGNVVLSDGAFYLRPLHMSLMRQGRLTARVADLAQVPDKLAKALLAIPDKHGSGCTYDDALELAKYKGLIPHLDGHDTFIKEAMGLL